MKVVLNARFYTRRMTGVERYAHELAREVAAALGPEDTLEAIAPRGELGAPPPDFPLTRRGQLNGHAWEQLVLPALLPRDADVLWSPCNVGPVAVRSQVLTLHDVFSITRPHWVSRKFHLWYKLLLPPLTARASHIITVSEWSRAEIIAALGVAPEKVTVIPEGVGQQFVPAGEDEIAAANERLELPEEFILALGSIEPRKNLARTFEAWTTLPEGSRPPLLIAGGMGSADVFGDQGRPSLLQAPGIRRLGYVPDELLPALYSRARLFVYVPFEEGFGLPPIEALACGTDVVTSATSALAEYGQGYARLVDPTSTEAIAAGLRASLESPTPRAARESRAAEVRRRFDWRIAAARTIEVLRAAAGR